MTILFKSVLSLSLSGTLLIVLLFLLKPLFRDRIGKRWQYYIWMIVIVRLLVPFTLPASPVNTLFRELDRTMVQITTVSEEDAVHVLYGGRDIAVNSGSFQAEKGISAAAPTPVSHNLSAVLIKNLWLVWLTGALLLLVRKIMVYQRFVRQVKAKCLEVSDIELLNRLAQYGEQIGVKVPVELYINSFISSPLLIGFFRPCIVLRTADLTESDLQYTLLHELTHYRHRDMFYKWIVQITLCLHWFNPFVYLMCREINRACELACDETIISKLEKKEQETYGEMLMNAVRAGGVSHNSIASMTLYENKKMIKERLGAIMNFKKKSIWMTLGSLVLVISLSAVSAGIGAYATPSITEGEPIESIVSPIADDGQGRPVSLAGTGNTVGDPAESNIIWDEGVYYIPSIGVPGTGNHVAGVSDGFIMFVFIREDSSVFIGPFMVTKDFVEKVTLYCDHMLEWEWDISQEEAGFMIETASKIQTGDDSDFIERNDWSTNVNQIWAIVREEYKACNAYYYQDEGGDSYYILGMNGSVRLKYDTDGDVNLCFLLDEPGGRVTTELIHTMPEETPDISYRFSSEHIHDH